MLWKGCSSSCTTSLLLSFSSSPLAVRSFPLVRSIGCRRSLACAVPSSTIGMSAKTSLMDQQHPPPLIDVDCNLWHSDLKPLLDIESSNSSVEIPAEFAILKQDAIQEANLVALLSPSSTLAEAKRGITLLNDFYSSSLLTELPIIRTTVGVHPYHVNDEGPPLNEQMESCVNLITAQQQQGSVSSPPPPVIVAMGECGLDASEGFPPLADQIPWFEAQIDLAKRFQMPLFVHERLAHKEAMQLLAQTTVPVLIHCFTGTVQECKAYMERGYYVSLSGYVCKEDSEATIACLTQEGVLSLDRLMIETDAPYMGFPGSRDLFLSTNEEAVALLKAKKRKRLTSSFYPNVPSSLPKVLDRVLELINQGRPEPISRDELALVTSRNANRFFGFGVNGLEQE